MAVVVPGTGGTIKSATAEGQLHEILSFISLKQQDELINPGLVSNILATHDQQALTFAGSYNLPVSLSIGPSGEITLAAVPYLVNPAFQVGTEGTFQSNTAEGYALEVLMHLQGLELQTAANPNNRNFITGTYNSDTGRYTGSFTLPVTMALDAVTGAVTYQAETYLL